MSTWPIDESELIPRIYGLGDKRPTIEDRFLEELKKEAGGVLSDVSVLPDVNYGSYSISPERERQVLDETACLPVSLADLCESAKRLKEIEKKVEKIERSWHPLYRLFDVFGISSPIARFRKYARNLERVSEDIGRSIKYSRDALDKCSERQKDLREFRRDAKFAYFKYKSLEQNLKASGAPAEEIDECAYKRKRAAAVYLMNSQSLEYLHHEQYFARCAMDKLEDMKDKLDLKICETKTRPSCYASRRDASRHLKNPFEQHNQASTVAVTATTHPYVAQDHSQSNSK